jgi:eight-cysteine-cluster-containing protein
MKKTILLISFLFVLIIAACNQIPTDKLSCNKDSDCICGGIDNNDKNCFIGNKLYYEEYVNKDKACPDFCGGKEGNSELKCVENKCTQVLKEQLQAECNQDTDCKKAGCSGQLCISADKEDVATTCEYKEEYACYQETNCKCVSNKCDWNDTPQFIECLEQAK